MEDIKQIKLLERQENFIKTSQQIHKNIDGSPKYDYSKVKYINNHTKVIIICPIHNEFLKTPKNHSYQGCQKCAIKKYALKSRKTVEQFIEDAKRVHTIVKYDYSRVHEDYELSKSKVKIGCPNCKTFFIQFAKDHLKGSACRNCKNKTQHIFFKFLRDSFGEESFETEKRFSDCVLYTNLPFDFYSKEYNLVIELDGRQHFTEVNIFRDTLEERQKKDFIKMEYLQEHNISLIRIFQEDVYENKNDWKNKILNCVQKYDSHQIIYLSSGNHYEEYNRRYEDYYTNNNYMEDLEKLNLTEDYIDDEEVENQYIEEEINQKANTA